MAEFVSGLRNATDDDGNKLHFEARLKELETEVRNLVTAIAKGKSPTPDWLEL
jgi:hypothetical protein